MSGSAVCPILSFLDSLTEAREPRATYEKKTRFYRILGQVELRRWCTSDDRGWRLDESGCGLPLYLSINFRMNDPKRVSLNLREAAACNHTRVHDVFSDL
jgi:hypothetical protein